jgi:hypothetical protein
MCGIGGILSVVIVWFGLVLLSFGVGDCRGCWNLGSSLVSLGLIQAFLQRRLDRYFQLNQATT